MKVKISFTLDLSKTLYSIKSPKDIKEGIANLSEWLQELQHHLLDMTVLIVSSSASKPERDASLAWNRQRIELATQIFNDYRVEGETEDGHSFVFTHKEPGYIEQLTLDGLVFEED